MARLWYELAPQYLVHVISQMFCLNDCCLKRVATCTSCYLKKLLLERTVCCHKLLLKQFFLLFVFVQTVSYLKLVFYK